MYSREGNTGKERCTEMSGLHTTTATLAKCTRWLGFLLALSKRSAMQRARKRSDATHHKLCRAHREWNGSAPNCRMQCLAETSRTYDGALVYNPQGHTMLSDGVWLDLISLMGWKQSIALVILMAGKLLTCEANVCIWGEFLFWNRNRIFFKRSGGWNSNFYLKKSCESLLEKFGLNICKLFI